MMMAMVMVMVAMMMIPQNESLNYTPYGNRRESPDDDDEDDDEDEQDNDDGDETSQQANQPYFVNIFVRGRQSEVIAIIFDDFCKSYTKRA